MGRDKRNRKIGTRKPGIAQSELDLPSQAAGPPVDERDSVSAVLGEVALRVTDNEQVGKEHEAHRSEMTAIDMPLERRGSIVILPLYHLLDGHDRDVSASAVLQEFRIVNGPVVIHDVRSLAVLADDDVRRIAERPSVQTIQRHL